MKFSIETQILARALDIASVAADHRLSIPILGSVLIEAKDSQLILSSTNLDLYVTQKLPAQVKEAGAITAPFTLLQKLVNRMTSTFVEMESDLKAINFTCGETTALLEALPAEEFPPAFKQSGKEVECDAGDILIPFAKIAHAISKDPTRYALMGINIANGEFAATDGKRAAIYRGQTLSEDNATAPDVFVRALLKIKPEGKIFALISDGVITVQNDAVKVSCKLIEATYPNLKQSIPLEGGKKVFSCGRDEMKSALRTCSVFNERELSAVEIEGNGKEIRVTHEEKAKVMVMGTELSGQPKLKMRFNPSFLLDVLSVLENESVRIQCTDEKSPMIIEEGALKTVVQIMMAK